MNFSFLKSVFSIILSLCILGCATEPVPAPTPATQQPKKVDIKPEPAKTPEKPEEQPVAVAEEAPPPAPKKAKIALLLPITGQYFDIGKNMQNSAELALFDISSEKIDLMPFDTKGTESGAKEAAKNAIKSKVDIILGPVFRHTTKAITKIIKDSDINLVSFSNDKALLEDDIFLLSFNPAEQIERVVDYAHQRGINEFSALVPDNTYGITTINELTQTLKQKKLPFKKIEWYLTTDVNLSKSIKRITRLEAGETDAPEKSQGLLIPEGGRTLLSMSSRIFRKGISNKRFRLLGSGEWDDEAIAREQKLIGSWFATSPPAQREIFEQNFRNSFGYKPIRIASLAYDGIALAAFLVKDDDYSRNALLNERGFVGVNGIFRFKENGTAERALSVIEITDEGFKIIDPAPESFTSPHK